MLHGHDLAQFSPRGVERPQPDQLMVVPRVGLVDLVGHVGLQHGAQDLLVLRTLGGERLVPFVAALVPEVQVDAGRVVIDAPPGLLE